MKSLTIRYIRDLILCAIFILLAKAVLAEPIRLNHRSSVNAYIPQETVVYVTNTGTKYHKGTCRYLSNSKIKTTLKKAQTAGNAACKVCRP